MKIFKRKLYYAHSMRIYNTAREAEETSIIQKAFPKYNLFCPNKHRPKYWETSSGDIIMESCLNIVRKSQIVVASEYLDYIGRGVYLEVITALEHKIPCYVIRSNEFFPILGVELIDLNWTVMYGKLITS